MGGESSGVENDYPEIFDALAHEYGWRFDEIAKLSFRELDWAFGAIRKRRDFEARRRHSEKQMFVKLLGGELAPLPDPESEEKVQFTPEESAQLDRERDEIFKRKQEALGGRRPHQNSG